MLIVKPCDVKSVQNARKVRFVLFRKNLIAPLNQNVKNDPKFSPDLFFNDPSTLIVKFPHVTIDKNKI